jgi:uncharacterized OB-fold protein
MPELDCGRCLDCAVTSYPRAATCARCGGSRVEPVHVEGTGRVVAVTALTTGAVAEVRLEAGLVVLGAVRPASAAAVGTAVRLVADGPPVFEPE